MTLKNGLNNLKRNSMAQIPTAEEYIEQYPYVDAFLSSAQGHQVLKDFMIGFAKMHVEAALKAAYENIEYTEVDSSVPYVVEDSILNSYPLTNIK
jgi:hypothetical protein